MRDTDPGEGVTCIGAVCFVEIAERVVTLVVNVVSQVVAFA